MRYRSYRSYLFLGMILLIMWSIPPRILRAVRYKTIGCFSPSWSSLRSLKMALAGFGLAHQTDGGSSAEVARLKQENQKLRQELDMFKQWALAEEHIKKEVDWLQHIRGRQIEDPFWKDFFQRRSSHLAQLLEAQHQSILASVIFREPGMWSSCLWVGVGERDNRALGQCIIAKNSPVVLRNSLVGLVEEVGESRSKVRLLTDARLVPSVRAIRGEQQGRFLLHRINQILSVLQKGEGLFSTAQEEQHTIQCLQRMKMAILHGWGDHFLAKGEISGSSRPLWRSRGALLQGVGFNYDFADDEGPARDLRSGNFLGNPSGREVVPLLRPGDLLITTGLDGVFPPGLEVGIVSQVHLLKEGNSSYSLEAIPAIEEFNEIEVVSILRPL